MDVLVYLSFVPVNEEYRGGTTSIHIVETSENITVRRRFLEAAMVEQMGYVNGRYIQYWDGGWHEVQYPLNSRGGPMAQWTVEAHSSFQIGTHMTFSNIPGAFIVDGHAGVEPGEVVVFVGVGLANYQAWHNAFSPNTNDRHTACLFAVGR